MSPRAPFHSVLWSNRPSPWWYPHAEAVEEAEEEAEEAVMEVKEAVVGKAAEAAT